MHSSLGLVSFLLICLHLISHRMEDLLNVPKESSYKEFHSVLFQNIPSLPTSLRLSYVTKAEVVISIYALKRVLVW